MSDHIPWPIIAKYLAGECNQKEMLFMETWLEQEENYLLLQQLENDWRNQQVSEDDTFDVGRGLDLLYSKIDHEENKTATATRLTIGANTWFLAASIVLIFGMTFNFYKNKTTLNPKITLIQTVSNTRGLIKVTLPDSSVVWLNKKSMLEYPSAFIGNQRTVTLKGDAFFEVTPDKNKPFIIKCNGMSTKVLGTSFEVKAYVGEHENEVAVLTGKVEVTTDASEAGHRTSNKILPGQKLIANLKNSSTYIKNVSLKSIALWRLDPLVFRDNSYQEVADQLEMRFEKKIHFKNENLKKCRVMANFNHDATLENILKLLSISNSFEYVIGSKTVTISGGFCH